MIIEISVANPDNSDEPPKKEWAIIELQGTLEMQSHCKDAPLAGKFIGDLHFTSTGQPTLIIGHHILYGKMSKLERPFALVKKKHVESVTGSQLDDAGRSADTTGTRYDVLGLIKHKLLFNQRPKPIIANVPKKV